MLPAWQKEMIKSEGHWRAQQCRWKELSHLKGNPEGRFQKYTNRMKEILWKQNMCKRQELLGPPIQSTPMDSDKFLQQC